MTVFDEATEKWLERLLAEAPPLSPAQQDLIQRTFGRVVTVAPSDRSSSQRAATGHRCRAVGAIIRVARGKQGWSVEEAAKQADLGHMTWRRVEDGDFVRGKTYAALDDVFSLPTGTTSRAVSDDNQVVELARRIGLDTAAVDTGDQSAYDFMRSIARVAPSGALRSEPGVDWEALGACVKARREELRLPQDLVDRGGPGEMTMRKIERGETEAIRNKTKTQLERVLGWLPGQVDRILTGESVAELPQPSRPSPGVDGVAIAQRLRALADEIEWAARHS